MASSEAKKKLLERHKNKPSNYVSVSLSPILLDIIVTLIAKTIYIFLILFYGEALYNYNPPNTSSYAYVAAVYVILLCSTLHTLFRIRQYFTHDPIDKGTKLHFSIGLMVFLMAVMTITWTFTIEPGGAHPLVAAMWTIGRVFIVAPFILVEQWIVSSGLAAIRRIKTYYRIGEGYCQPRIEVVIVFLGFVFEFPRRKSLLDY